MLWSKTKQAKKEGMEQTCVVVQSSMLQVLGTRFRAGFVYNMGDEEASKDAGQHAGYDRAQWSKIKNFIRKLLGKTKTFGVFMGV